MSRGRNLVLPHMGRAPCALACGVLLVVCLAAGLGMRASLTDYNVNPGALTDITYAPSRYL